jgi:quercetin dioxygenase-like cupin family protein
MKIANADAVEAVQVDMAGARGAQMRMLIGPEDNAPTFHMRQFTLDPGGHTPLHSHPWEHEVYILAGSGTVATPDGPRPISAGDVIYVPGGEEHQFRGDSAGPLTFLCLVPREQG